MPSIHRVTRRAAGYILLEAILALAVFSGIAAYQIRQQRDELVEGMAAAQGRQMRKIADAANLYAVDNFPRILNNAAVPIGVGICPAGGGGGVNVVTTRSPTIAELACLGFLPAGFANAAMFGGGYQIQLNTTPGCVMPACNVEGYLITTAPVRSDNIVSAKVIGRALLEIGPDGGASGLAGPANAVQSLGTGNPIATPGFAVQAGMIAVNLGSTVTQFDQYLRRDGSRPMTGPLNMLSDITGLRQNINGANEVNATTVNGTTVNTTDLAVNGQVVTALNMVGNNINGANEVNATTVNGSTVNGSTVNGSTVNGSTVNGWTINGSTANVTTVNGSTVNTSTLTATTIVSPQKLLHGWEQRGIQTGKFNLDCDPGEVVIGLRYEGTTWTNNLDSHSGPEIPNVICSRVAFQ